MNPQLLALAVHDIKNVLGILDGELNALAEAPDAALARAAQQHCADLRRRLVAFLTLYRGAEEVRAQVEDESPLEFVQSLARHAARPAGALLRLAPCDAAPPYWHFDRHLVRLALEAALHNAWRHARGDVAIGVRAQDGFLVFCVDDDGPGLAGGVGDDDGASAATGLGNELCNAVANAHRVGDRNGRIELGDRAGGGARFELWLP